MIFEQIINIILVALLLLLGSSYLKISVKNIFSLIIIIKLTRLNSKLNFVIKCKI